MAHRKSTPISSLLNLNVGANFDDPNNPPIAINGISSSSTQIMDDDKFNEFSCPICLDIMEEAYITKCGHTFCFHCIQKSVQRFNKCPKCSSTLNLDMLIPNSLLNDLILKYKTKIQLQETAINSKVSGLKEIISTQSENLTLPDINIILDILTQRKNILESESSAAQNRLLYEFLKHLLKQKEELQLKISREINIVKKDIQSIENILGNTTSATTTAMDLEDSLLPKQTVVEKQSQSQLGINFQSRKRRMYAHFDDFVTSYFTARDPENYSRWDKKLYENQKLKGAPYQGLENFRENLVNFARYTTLRPLATMHYSSDLHISSTIVSTITFDKDNEYFAIGGVTKRIKVYDYMNTIKDVVDIHYPSVEMVSGSKISCLSWNSQHKQILASSDYEGSVMLWNVATGQKTKCFHEHEKRCWSVDFNEVDSKLIVSGSDDARVKLWSINDEHSIATLEAKANVCCVKFNPKSSCHLAFGAADHDVRYYDLRNLNKALCVFKGHKKAVSYVKFLNTHEIISASTDSQLKLWDVNSPPISLRSFTGHINEKNFVGLATDRDYIACGSEDNSLYVYYKGLSKQLLSYRIDVSDRASDLERSNDINEFVSAVCWRKQCDVVLAANSRGGPLKAGDSRLFWGIDSKYTAVAVTGVSNEKLDDLEGLDGAKESIRIGASNGANALLKEKIVNIEVEDFSDSENAAIGSVLGTFKYQELRNKEKKSPIPKLQLADGAEGSTNWGRGQILADSQNFAKSLMEAPANLMTPSNFAKIVTEELKPHQVEVISHDKAWAEQMKMGSYLSVSKGSDEPPVFLELTYKGAGDSNPFVCLVGKGITFDSGGISIKPSANMDAMRADMGGAANVSGTIRALALLKAKVNVKGLIPLCENMPNGSANKPGDVVVAMNGKTICIDNTDAEGRLILADALCYSERFNPKLVLDIATLTGAIKVALGDCVSGVFTNDENIWKNINHAARETGDRVWRMPLYKHYRTQLTDYTGYDINNMGKGKGGGACIAAAFLSEFVPKNTPWIHVDMAGVMGDCSDQSYSGSKGMTGRPLRTLVEFVLRSSA